MFDIFPGLFGIQFYMARTCVTIMSKVKLRSTKSTIQLNSTFHAVLKVNRSEQNIFQHL